LGGKEVPQIDIYTHGYAAGYFPQEIYDCQALIDAKIVKRHRNGHETGRFGGQARSTYSIVSKKLGLRSS